MIYFLILLLVSYCVVEFVFTFGVGNHRRRRLGQPSFRDIVRMCRPKLDLKSHGSLSRGLIANALAHGGPTELDRLIREKFRGGTGFTDWSIDYLYPHYDYHGKHHSGQWLHDGCERDATIYFYNRRVPVAPPAPPKPEPKVEPVSWSDKDESQRIELFLANPLAFWLNPDWSDPSRPFWMLDPAPILSRFLPVTDRIERAVEAIAFGDYQKLDRITVSGRDDVIYLIDDGEELILTKAEYRQASRLARKLYR